MAHRLRSPNDPVSIEHDGERIVAERGESIAQALVAADRLLLARSPKLHRPRGPYCLRGACDGCLVRVNGVPNVTTCLVPVQGGERIETQNVLGSRGVDMLRATDFLFPRGMDHHRLLAGITGLSSVVQKFARRVAGLGRLPSEVGQIRPAERLDVDVLVVGAGRAGLSAAAELGGLRTLLADDGLAAGGALALLDPAAARAAIERVRAAGVELASRTTVAALLREPEDAGGRLFALVMGPDGARLVRTRAAVLATGAHDPTLAFDNNDLPGVMSARAALALWRGGVAIGKRVAIVGSGRFADTLERELDVLRVDESALVRAVGRSRVRAMVVRDGTRQERLPIDALLVDGPSAPAFELAVQSGGDVTFDPGSGFVPSVSDDGAIGERVWVASRATGSQPEEVAARVRRALEAQSAAP